MHQMAIKPQTKLETLRSIYTLVFQKRLTITLVMTSCRQCNNNLAYLLNGLLII